jgi:parvulin-like peptidyl-prolyl isomerase
LKDTKGGAALLPIPAQGKGIRAAAMMKSQTTARTDHQRTARSSKSSKAAKKYVRQTAHVEARRDGKPLIFGWGGHLSISQKDRLQKRAVWITTLSIIFILLITVLGYWIKINVTDPNLTITSVNGQPIPQSDYRKLLALKAQIVQNEIKGPNGLQAQSDQLRSQLNAQQTVVDNLNKKIEDLNTSISKETDSTKKANLQKDLDQAKKDLETAKTKLTDLTNQNTEMTTNTLPLAQQRYVRGSLGGESAQWLQEDQLIRQWLAKQSPAVQSKINPTDAAISEAISKFKANLPRSVNYDKFLSSSHISNDDVRVMMALIVRRTTMQTYLAEQITSPAYQVKASLIQVATEKDAQDILTQLKQPNADFAKLAKEKSTSDATKEKGGDLDWMARGQFTQLYASNSQSIVDNWLFDPARKLNELSAPIYEGGVYKVLKITGIEQSREIPKDTLDTLKKYSLEHWLMQQKALPGIKITDIDQGMMLDESNMPPDLPESAPSTNPTGA